MKKIVINACYGGFSLSEMAEDLYAEKSGFELFRYENNFGSPYELIKNGKGGFLVYTLTKNHGPSISELPHETRWSSRDIDRTDPILIDVIEELGSEKASGCCAELKIIEIPDDVDGEIEEYDGREWVAEKHRTWS